MPKWMFIIATALAGLALGFAGVLAMTVYADGIYATFCRTAPNPESPLECIRAWQALAAAVLGAAVGAGGLFLLWSQNLQNRRQFADEMRQRTADARKVIARDSADLISRIENLKVRVQEFHVNATEAVEPTATLVDDLLNLLTSTSSAAQKVRNVEIFQHLQYEDIKALDEVSAVLAGRYKSVRRQRDQKILEIHPPSGQIGTEMARANAAAWDAVRASGLSDPMPVLAELDKLAAMLAAVRARWIDAWYMHVA